MWSANVSSGLIVTLGGVVVPAISVYLLHFLPSEVLIFLMAWTLVSFPIGVLIGHCVLSGE